MMRIAFLGDIALIGKYDLSNGNEAYERLKPICDIVQDCDFVIGNLENVITKVQSTRVCKGAYLRTNPLNVALLNHLGVTHVSLANNHIQDYGIRAIKDTIRVLEDNGIEWIGLGGRNAFLKKSEERVLLTGMCCYSANGVSYGKKEYNLNVLDYTSSKKFLEVASKQGCTGIISAHFGVEELHTPSYCHIKMFRELAEQYNYIAHGHHTHSIQGVEQVNGSLLMYSQGNLCFDNVTETSIGKNHLINECGKETYISIVEIINGHIERWHTVGLIDGINGLSTDKKIDDKLKEYSKILTFPIEKIKKIREEEIRNNTENNTKKDISFILNRLNRKYIGAFLRGKYNGAKYNKKYIKYKEQL